ncbi:MAG: acetyl-CoA carboxylase carboxyltransferase subunit alpha [Planctomycetes bacterium]|jgi:acetyl-CoA carboxylase carboxyl transferase subunit alpha|nr:acetyl-CoA carboxylase carboxyltransferase subunit alpha [Planctomycetota bacterium]
MAESESNIDTAAALPFEKPIIRLAKEVADLESEQIKTGRDYGMEIRQLRAQYVSLLQKTYQQLTPWETVLVARHPQRPLGLDYINMVVKNFVPLHGDRRFADDKAIIGGLGRVGTEKVMCIAQHKGRDTKEKLERNFGMPHPEGYRKALRLMKLAEKFTLPVVTLIDTTGAYPGIGSEERGVAEAIALNLREMSRLKTPIVCVIIGEGGSGGALGIGVGDRVAVMQYAYYSVISPEGCASILWRTGEKAAEAAEAMKLVAPKLKELGVVDDIVKEPLGGAHRNPAEAGYNLERYIVRTLRNLNRLPTQRLLDQRYATWRAKGRVKILEEATA